MLTMEGFTYQKDKQNGTRTFWRCNKYFETNCRSRVILNDQNIVKGPKDHNHGPDIFEKSKRDAISSIKHLSNDPHLSADQIIEYATNHLSDIEKGSIRPMPLLKQTILRQRNHLENRPREPTNLQELFVPGDYKCDNDGNRFFLHDNFEINNRIIIFCSDQGLNLLTSQKEWFCDGTFKTVPSHFQQLYTIHVKIHESVLPVAYILTSSKTFICYSQIIAILRIYNYHLNPERIVMDFEIAALNAFSANFPNATINGCYFHLSQCMWRKIQENKATLQRYKSDGEFMLHIKMILALAFLPIDDVELAFLTLTASPFFIANLQHLQPIINYFEKTYVGYYNEEGIHTSPLISIKTWNVFNSTLSSQPRTNNHVEGWHNSFSRRVNCSHPGFFKFINLIKSDHQIQKLKIQQLLAGQVITRQEKRYKEINTSIRRILQSYDITDVFNYLKNIAINIKI